MTLDRTDRAAAKLVVEQGGEPNDPRLKLAVRAAAIATDRWGRDLARGPGEQEFAAFDEVLREVVEDVLEYYADEDAHVSGVDGLVFEGRVVDAESLAGLTEMTLRKIERAGGVDRHEPGPLVETVEDGGRDE